MDFAGIDAWGFGSAKPFLIAGPCSAETETQVWEVMSELAAGGKVSLFRAGVWKPRTRPGNFEGMGEPALGWIAEAKKKFNLPASVEIATAKHAELALKYGMDVLWIGARTTANPFAVQEIAEAVGKSGVPIIVKNPVNPDLALWIGAVERLRGAGVLRIAALHRGFSSYGEKHYRNAPMWQIAVEMKSHFPQIPLLCDPSHIGGKRELIAPLSQTAMDFGYDGLMIETHCRPAEAWSDAAQQVTPRALDEIMQRLVVRDKTTQSGGQIFSNHIADLRSKIDIADSVVLDALAVRFNLVKEIGELKTKANIAAFQIDRWQDVSKSRSEWAGKSNLDKNFVNSLFGLLHEESLRLQSEAGRKKA